MIKKLLLVTTLMIGCYFSYAQNVGSSPEYIKALTTEWKGERFPDGRPKVSSPQRRNGTTSDRTIEFLVNLN